MQRAGTAAFQLLQQRWPHVRKVLVVCGKGNNGGDGYVVAAAARAERLDVQLIALGDPPDNGEAARARAAYIYGGGSVDSIDVAWRDCEVCVDALLGIGLTRAPDLAAATVIERINALGRSVLSLDVPSGLDADTGAALGAVVRADATLTFIGAKRGLYTGAAAKFCGEVYLYRLGITEDSSSPQPDARLLDSAFVRSALTQRVRDANKGAFGHVLAIGGDVGMGGAIRLSGEAALRVGAGLVSIATRHDNVPAINSARPELMAHGVSGAQELEALLARANVIALGPGLGQAAWGHALWYAAIASGKPLILDADGLNLLAIQPIVLPEQTVLTPHPGEAARLLGVDIAAISRDRFAAVRELARRYQAVAVLKGAGSLIANPCGEIAVCPWGNPGMATGGMGDVLTGIIAGLAAQHFDAWHAARIGVALHARAGDLAARDGEAGLVASDLFAALRKLRNGIDAP